MIVLDASAGVELLAGKGPLASRVSDRLAPLTGFHVPDLFGVEVMNALRGLERGRRMSEFECASAIGDLVALRCEHWRHEELLPEAWRRRHRHSIYDAAYIALAKLLDLPLVTTDRKLAEAAGDDVAVELLAA